MAPRFCWVQSGAVRSVEVSCRRFEAAIEGGATARIDRTWRFDADRAELADQIAEDDRHQASQMVAQAT